EPRPETLPALLARLRAGGRPVILTARAGAEGGRPMDEARRRALYTSGLPHTDAIDVEIASTALAAELVPQARAAGQTVVLSAHPPPRRADPPYPSSPPRPAASTPRTSSRAAGPAAPPAGAGGPPRTPPAPARPRACPPPPPRRSSTGAAGPPPPPYSTSGA